MGLHFMAIQISKENFVLDALYEDAHRELNPNDDECWNCGGEGYTADCFDGCCEDAESGCEDCSRPCPECARFKADIERYVRVQVLRSFDVPLARAWISRKGRAKEGQTDQFILANLHAGRAGCKDFTEQERGDSACWVECLL